MTGCFVRLGRVWMGECDDRERRLSTRNSERTYSYSRAAALARSMGAATACVARRPTCRGAAPAPQAAGRGARLASARRAWEHLDRSTAKETLPGSRGAHTVRRRSGHHVAGSIPFASVGRPCCSRSIHWFPEPRQTLPRKSGRDLEQSRVLHTPARCVTTPNQRAQNSLQTSASVRAPWRPPPPPAASSRGEAGAHPSGHAPSH